MKSENDMEDLINSSSVFLDTRYYATVFQSYCLAFVFKRLGVRKVLGLDEPWNITPLLIACKKMHVTYTGLQHGYYTKYHIGVLQNIIPKEFTIKFPKLLLWGESSWEILEKYSQIYEKKDVEISGYIRSLPERISINSPSLPFNVLYPYEFLANKAEINRYIRVMLSKGYKVYFKVRWDEPLHDQLAGLPPEIVPVHQLEELQKINISVCAGTSTSFLHEMYFLGYPIWYLDTKTDYLEDMVHQGFANMITLEMLEDSKFDPNLHLTRKRDSSAIFKSGSMLQDKKLEDL